MSPDIASIRKIDSQSRAFDAIRLLLFSFRFSFASWQPHQPHLHAPHLTPPPLLQPPSSNLHLPSPKLTIQIPFVRCTTPGPDSHAVFKVLLPRNNKNNSSNPSNGQSRIRVDSRLPLSGPSVFRSPLSLALWRLLYWAKSLHLRSYGKPSGRGYKKCGVTSAARRPGAARDATNTVVSAYNCISNFTGQGNGSQFHNRIRTTPSLLVWFPPRTFHLRPGSGSVSLVPFPSPNGLH